MSKKPILETAIIAISAPLCISMMATMIRSETSLRSIAPLVNSFADKARSPETRTELLKKLPTVVEGKYGYKFKITFDKIANSGGYDQSTETKLTCKRAIINVDPINDYNWPTHNVYSKRFDCKPVIG